MKKIPPLNYQLIMHAMRLLSDRSDKKMPLSDLASELEKKLFELAKNFFPMSGLNPA